MSNLSYNIPCTWIKIPIPISYASLLIVIVETETHGGSYPTFSGAQFTDICNIE